jgi:hypothetical protein
VADRQHNGWGALGALLDLMSVGAKKMSVLMGNLWESDEKADVPIAMVWNSVNRVSVFLFFFPYHLMARSSTSKMSVEFGPMMPPSPRSP